MVRCTSPIIKIVQTGCLFVQTMPRLAIAAVVGGVVPYANLFVFLLFFLFLFLLVLRRPPMVLLPLLILLLFQTILVCHSCSNHLI